MWGRHRTLVAVHAVVLVAGVTGVGVQAQTVMSGNPLDLGPGIHAILSVPELGAVPSDSSTVSATLNFLRVDVEGAIASYQGEVHFDDAALEVVAVTFPPEVMGAWNVIEPGRLRFAGLVANGLSTPLAMKLELVARRPLEASDFRRIVVEEITAATTFRNLTGEVVEHDPVMVVTEPVGR